MASRGKTRLATREARSPLSRLRLYALRWRYNTPLHQTWTFRWPTSQYKVLFIPLLPPALYISRAEVLVARAKSPLREPTHK